MSRHWTPRKHLTLYDYKAFFYKLFKLGITGKMWTLLVNAHTAMASCLQVNGIRSNSFPVRQGIRQGGVISTWIYNLFIDELLNNLEQSGHSVKFLNHVTGNTTLADVVTLCALTPVNLQYMLDIVYRYMQQYRYQINASKSFLITFGMKGRSAKYVQFYMGSDTIVNTDCIKHVGVHINKQLNDKVKVQNGCCKAKTALFSLLSIKMHPLHLNPLIISKVCIPRLLFGAELWSNLSNSDCMTLERFVRLVAKKIQGFHVRTRTDISLSMLGWKSVVSQIDYRKLSFMGRLGNMPNTVHAKRYIQCSLIHLYMSR